MKTTIKYFFIFLFFIAVSHKSFSQCEVSMPDTFVCHFSDRLDLRPIIIGSKITDDYRVESIPFNFIDPVNSSQVQLLDDDVSSALNLGFEFEYFGQLYSQFYIGSNGWISFSPNQSINYLSNSIPDFNSNLTPMNAIFGAWEDWDPVNGGEISYQIFELEESKKLVVTFSEISHYICGEDSLVSASFQIVLNEFDYSIETHILNKSSCQSVVSVQGIHNQDGTSAIVVDNRNSTVWQAFQESIIYLPSNVQNFSWEIEGEVLSDSVVLSHDYYESQEVTLNFSDYVGCVAEVVFNVTVFPELDVNTFRVQDYLYAETVDDIYNIQWYLEGELLEGETSDSVELVEHGNYFLELYDPLTECSYFSRAHLYISVSISNFLQDDLVQIFPNPSKDKVHFSFSTSEKMDVAIYNAQGQLVMEFDNSSMEMKSLNFESGIYIVKISDRQFRSIAKKIIIN